MLPGVSQGGELCRAAPNRARAQVLAIVEHMTVPDSAFARFLPAAYEGAHVRAIAGGVGAAAEQLAGLNPRSIVVIATDGLAQRCAQAGGDLLAPLPVPYVVTATLPPFVGALDVVIVVGDRGESPDAEQAVRVAARRGAATVLICPDSGPLRDDAPSSTVCLPIPVSATDRSPLRFLVGIYTVVALLSEDPDLLAEQLRGVADLVDEELAACAPDRDAAVNPARDLAHWVRGVSRRPLATHVAARPDGRDRTVASVNAYQWAIAGAPGTALWGEDVPAPAAPPDLFYDPFLDSGDGGGSEGASAPVAVVAWDTQCEPLADPPAGWRVEKADDAGFGRLGAVARLLARGRAASVYLADGS